MVSKFIKYPFIYSFLFWFILLTLNLLFFSILKSSAATQISLEWVPNNEPDIAGYKIFYREISQSYDYSNPFWEGIITYCTFYDLDENKTYCFVARAFDTEGFESKNSNEVCHGPLAIPNQPPTADAGPDQTVNEGQVVSLNGSNSTDPEDGIVSYHWVQLGGPIIYLSDPDIKQPTFSAPNAGPGGTSLVFNLTVTDVGGLQNTDACIVNINRQNKISNNPPIADFSFTTNTIRFNLSTIRVAFFTDLSTDSDGTIVSWFWDFGDGHTSTVKNPIHWYRNYGNYTITLSVADDDGMISNLVSENVTVTK